MTITRYQKHYQAQDDRISVDFVTDHGQYHASHWLNELELIYFLNGNAHIVLDGKNYSLVQGDFIAIDSNHVFELQCKENFMQIRVRIDKEFLAMRTGYESHRVYSCIREEIESSQLEPYLEICDLFKELVPLYVNEPEGFRLKTESVVLEILYCLVQHFSYTAAADEPGEPQEQTRIQQILAYIEENEVKFINGERSLDEYDAYRDTLRSMGIDKCIALQQSSLDRYNNR